MVKDGENTRGGGEVRDGEGAEPDLLGERDPTETEEIERPLPTEDTAEERPTTLDMSVGGPGLGALHRAAGDGLDGPGLGNLGSVATRQVEVRPGSDVGPSRVPQRLLLAGVALALVAAGWSLMDAGSESASNDTKVAQEASMGVKEAPVPSTGDEEGSPPAAAPSDVAPKVERVPKAREAGAIESPKGDADAASRPARTAAEAPAKTAAAAPAAAASDSSSDAGGAVRGATRAADTPKKAAGSAPNSGAGAPPVEPEADPVDAAVRIRPRTEPSADGAASPAAADGSGASDGYRVEFISLDPGLSGIEVQCVVGSGRGTTSVVLEAAGPGSCRVIGRREGGSLVAGVTVSGPQTFQCFENGRRTCR